MTPGPASNATGARPAGRYGDGHRSPYGRVALVGLVLLLAAALGWWLWIAAVRSSPPVSWSLIGFDTVTDNSVDIRWTVDRDEGTAVDCVLRARDASGEEVGRARVSVTTAGDSPVELRSTLITAAPPVTGEVLVCAARSE